MPADFIARPEIGRFMWSISPSSGVLLIFIPACMPIVLALLVAIAHRKTGERQCRQKIRIRTLEPMNGSSTKCTSATYLTQLHLNLLGLNFLKHITQTLRHHLLLRFLQQVHQFQEHHVVEFHQHQRLRLHR